MSRALAESFQRQIEGFLDAYPHVVHEWREEPGERKLLFPSTEPHGFEVWVVISDDTLIVGAGGAHDHFEYETSGPEAVAAEAIGFVRDLLSPAMRLRERRAGAEPIHWTLERLHRGEWLAGSSTGTLFFNWFAPRSEAVKQNHTLPPRADAV